MERGSAAPPPFLTTPTLDIILYPPCDPLPPLRPLPPPPPAQPPYDERRETCPAGFSLYVRAEKILRPRLCGTHTATRNDTMPTFRAALSFAPPSVRQEDGCSSLSKGNPCGFVPISKSISIFFLSECDYIIIISGLIRVVRSINNDLSNKYFTVFLLSFLL